MNITIGILTGGKSRRMGKDKALLLGNGKTFLQTLIQEFENVGEIVISVADDNQYKDIGYVMIKDELKDAGPLEGLRQILTYSQHEYVFVCAVDIPYIKKEFLYYLMQFISRDFDCFVVKDATHIHPLCAIYHKSMLPSLNRYLQNGGKKALDWIHQENTKFISMEYSKFTPRLLQNINTKSDYEGIRGPIVFCVSGYKNSGKTTLIVKLLHYLKKHYANIAVIKHDGHDFKMDVPDTDTSYFQEAGARKTAIFSSLRWAMIDNTPDTTLESILEKMHNMDIVIIEGMKHSIYPKVYLTSMEDGNQTEFIKGPIIVTTGQTIPQNKYCSENWIDIKDIQGISKKIIDYFQSDKL